MKRLFIIPIFIFILISCKTNEQIFSPEDNTQDDNLRIFFSDYDTYTERNFSQSENCSIDILDDNPFNLTTIDELKKKYSVVFAQDNNCSSILCTAIMTNNITLCDKTDNPTMCKITLIEDNSFCSEMEYSEQNICNSLHLLVSASKNKNINKCDEIEILEYKYLCKNLIEFDANRITDFSSEYCIAKNMQTMSQEDNHNSFFCFQIKDKRIQTNCFDNSIEKIAFTTYNMSMCNLIRDESQRKNCSTRLSHLLYKKAIETKDPMLCKEIIRNREKCLEVVDYKINIMKYATKEIESPFLNCSRYTTDARDICFFDYSRNTINSSMCNLIKTDNYRLACLGITTNNKENCSKIDNKVYQDLCLYFRFI